MFSPCKKLVHTFVANDAMHISCNYFEVYNDHKCKHLDTGNKET